ncbi:hypothetical protein TUMEXPCC7403_15300 [Tumidithrix helvetica PCC 7403]|uniref:DUF262 domain-containing protein n=1 Tax=Tumidithrix helvetica TaxID=3457545 RepID=UPI003C8BE918
MSSETSKFDVEAKNINKLFSDPSIAYEVPNFQRPYSWGVEEVGEMLSDVYDSDWLESNNQNSSYFLGSIVLSQGEESDLVLDGQQRLTTICLLLAILKTLLQQEGLEQHHVQAIDSLLTAGKILQPRKPKIKLQDIDSAIYFSLITNPLKSVSEGNGSLLSKAVSEILEKINKYSNDLIERRKISKKDALGEMLKRILYNVELVQIKAPSESAAFKLFETLNDRGLALNAADLIKNKLFAQCDEQELLEEAFDSWQNILDTVGDGQILNFLRYYWIAFKGAVSRNGLYDAFRNDLSNKSLSYSIEFLRHLTDSAKTYRHITSPDPKSCPWRNKNETAEGLQRLKVYRTRSFISALLVCSEKDPSSVSLLTRVFESVAVRYSVVGELNTNQLEKVYVSICQRLRNESGKVDLILRDEFNPYVPTNDEFFEKFSRLKVNTKSSVWRTILIRINESYSNGETKVEGPDKVHIEHLLPQKPSKEALKEANLTEVDVEELKNRIGNLTLLLGRKNQSISNSSFSKKVPVLRESVIALNKEVLREYKEGEPWGRSQIEQRSKQLARKAVEIWPWPVN